MKVEVKIAKEDICRINIQGYGPTTALVEPSHTEGYILSIPSTGYALGTKIVAKTSAAIADGVARLWPVVEAFWAEQARAGAEAEESDWY